MDKLISKIFLVVGVLITIGSFLWINDSYQFTKISTVAIGQVIDTNYGGSHPGVSFITADNQKVMYYQDGLVFGYKMGERIEVIYDPKTPAHVSVNTFGALYGFPVLGTLLGLAFIITSVLRLKFNNDK